MLGGNTYTYLFIAKNLLNGHTNIVLFLLIVHETKQIYTYVTLYTKCDVAIPTNNVFIFFSIKETT